LFSIDAVDTGIGIYESRWLVGGEQGQAAADFAAIELDANFFLFGLKRIKDLACIDDRDIDAVGQVRVWCRVYFRQALYIVCIQRNLIAGLYNQNCDGGNAACAVGW